MKKLDQIKATILVRAFSFFKIPLLGWIRPSIVEMDEARTILSVPLSRRTKNHLNCMYFGALAIGAEAAVAVRAVTEIQRSQKRVDFLFKDFDAKFLKRAEASVHFVSDEGKEVRALIEQAIQSPNERFERTFRSYAVVPSQNPDEIIGEFRVTMTVKYRRKS